MKLRYNKIFIKLVTISIFMNYLNNLCANTITSKDTSISETRVSLNKINYIAPLNYSHVIHNDCFQPPANQTNQSIDINFQYSMKILLLEKFISPNNNLYFGYTQNSYWQAYNESPYFRSSNYEPEVFIRGNINKNILLNWKLSSYDLGYVHQSNGAGGLCERTWNRVYLNFILNNNKWDLGFHQWIVIRNTLYEKHNNDLAEFLGYGLVYLSYHTNDMKFSIATSNKILSKFKYGNFQFICTYKINDTFNIMLRLFTGFGQNLIEYNHRTTSIRLGLSINDTFF